MAASPHSHQGVARRGATWACLCGVLSMGACAGPTPTTSPLSGSFTVDDVLRRCIAAHEQIKTLSARGMFLDHRDGSSREVPISWAFIPPHRCRLQIDMEVTLILERRWWKYDPTFGEYRGYPHFTRTPVETAIHLSTGGVPFMLSEVISKGARAFNDGHLAGFGAWRLEGVKWQGDHPCYVVSRRERAGADGGVWRVWIDQDLFLLRGWSVHVPAPGGEDKMILGCRYHDLVVNQPLRSDCFFLDPPTQIVAPPNDATAKPPATTSASTRAD